jgi:hypothetical protein
VPYACKKEVPIYCEKKLNFESQTEDKYPKTMMITFIDDFNILVWFENDSWANYDENGNFKGFVDFHELDLS